VLTFAAELDDKNIARISHEELRLLRETSERVEKLVERNVYLSDELERWKGASTRFEGLENENKRLAGELAQRLKQQQQDVGTPKPRLQFPAGSKSTMPAPSDPRSSAAAVEADESKTIITWEKHRALITKYNNLWDHYRNLKDARQTMEDGWRAEKEKAKTLEVWAKEQESTISKKEDKIQRLEEENRRLRARVNGRHPISIVPLLRPGGDNADENGGEITRVVQVPGSSPSIAPRVRTCRKEPGSTTQTPGGAGSPTQQESPTPEEPNLPAYRGVAETRVEDTEFEAIEGQHTSSTEGSDPVSPSKAVDHEQVSVEKPTAERSSSPDIEFISARGLKKRKATHNSQTIKTEVKIETISSSPIGLARLQYLNPSESLDLDDIGEKVVTPKKQRRVVELTRHVSSSVPLPPLAARCRNHTQNQAHSNTTEQEEPGHTSQEAPVQRRDSILRPRSTNRQILPRTSEDRPPKKRRIASDEAVGELVEDGEISAAATKSRRQTTNSGGLLDGLLARPSPPKQVLNPRLDYASDKPPRPARTPVTASLAREVHQNHPQDTYDQIIKSTTARLKEYFSSSSRRLGRESAETSRPSSEGSSHSSSAEPILPSSRTSLRESAHPSRPTSKGTSRGSAEPTRPTSRSIARVEVSNKLVPTHNLIRYPLEHTLRKPSLETDEPNILPSKRPPITSYFTKASPRTPAKASRPNSRQSAVSSKSATTKIRRSRNGDGSDWEIDPDQEPLRIRPVGRLKLGDFKVNPNYNQGYDYAFNEVVRGREARQCLQGCTKPECCGRKFRVLAEMNREATGPPTLSQEEADEMLLDEYLGDNAYKMSNMSKEEREELIIQAKTRDMANKFGRHRHAYERRTSPPGFWRADFPTTQEEREDREKAHEIARSAVEERYKEAMRPNGRFIFRDE
jgi:hypothetical protein